LETTQGNGGNGTEQPRGNGADKQGRRAQSSTERSRKHRAAKKAKEAALKAEREREAALQKAEAERVAEAVADVADVAASTENAVADAAPGPAEQKAEREAAALHEAEKAECQACATETATIERFAGRVADVAGDVASAENAPGNVVPARAVERFAWRIMLSPAEHPPVPHPARRSPALALALFAVGTGLGAVGLIINGQFTMSYGRSNEEAILLAAIGFAIDVLAMILPATASTLWRHGACVDAVIAWLVWPVMLALSLLATVGFSSTNIGDALAQRSMTVTKASNTASDLQQWRNERSKIVEARSLEEIKLQLVRDRPKVDRIDRDAFEVTFGCKRLTADTMKACGPILPTLQALETAKRRDELTRKISTAANNQEGAPAVTSADPQVEQVPKLVALITRGWVAPTPDDIALVRILGPTMVPSLAGLLLMFGSTLWAPRTAPQSPGGKVRA
jgi:hypothetical protein